MIMLEGSKSIGAGAATIALVGAAIGIGNVFSSLINSVARNECKLYIKLQVLNFKYPKVAKFLLFMPFTILILL